MSTEISYLMKVTDEIFKSGNSQKITSFINGAMNDLLSSELRWTEDKSREAKIVKERAYFKFHYASYKNEMRNNPSEYL